MISMFRRTAAMLMLALTALTPQLFSQSIPPEVIHYPELIVYNGKIVTMNDQSFESKIGDVVQAMAQQLSLGHPAAMSSGRGSERTKL